MVSALTGMKLILLVLLYAGFFNESYSNFKWHALIILSLTFKSPRIKASAKLLNYTLGKLFTKSYLAFKDG